MGSGPRAVIFDVDGVLVDSYRAHLESWVLMAREHGLHITEREFATTFGVSPGPHPPMKAYPLALVNEVLKCPSSLTSW